MPRKKQFDDPNATMEAGAPGDEKISVAPKTRAKRGPKPADNRMSELKSKHKAEIADLKATIKLERLTKGLSDESLLRIKASIEKQLEPSPQEIL